MADSGTWSQIVDDYLSGLNTNAASKFAEGLTNKEVSLLEIVQCLGSAFTASDTNRRVEGTTLLAETLHQIPQDLLSFAEVELLSSFLSDRLSDHHSLQPPALHGLAALSNCCNIPSFVPERVCQRIFREVHNQTLAQKDRFSVYTVLYNFLTSKIEDLRKMESDFICGFIQAMDGEKDPRNLRFAFQCAQLIIKNLPLGVFVEEMFEITACYFPIDFQPPPNNPFGVQKEELVTGLRGCLSGSPLFAPFVLPLLSDKIMSDIQEAKIDAMHTLASVAKIYGAEALNKHLSLEIIFSVLKKEYGSGVSEMQKPCLEVLAALVSTLSLHIEEDGSSPSLDPFLDCILTACKLDYENESQFTNYSQILHCTASASFPAGCYMLRQVLPKLLQMYKDASQTNQKELLLNCFLGFILATKPTNQIKEEEESAGAEREEANNPICDYHEEIFTLLVSTLSNTSVSLCQIVVQCLGALLDYQNVFSNSDKILIMEHILILIQNKDEFIQLRDQCIKVLSNMACTSPEIIKENVLPLLYQTLKKEDPINKCNEYSWKSILTTLEILSSICCNSFFVEIILKEIWNWIQDLLKDDINQRSEVTELFHKVLKAIVKIVSFACDTSPRPPAPPPPPSTLDHLYTWFLPRFFQLTIPHLLESNVSFATEGILDNGATILRQITAKLDKSKAENLCQQVVSLFLHGNLSVFQITINTTDSQFHPLKFESPVQQTRLTGFLTAVVCSALPSVSISELNQLLERLTDVSLFSSDEMTRLMAAKCSSGLFNKYSQMSPAKEYLESVQIKLKSKIINPDKSNDNLQINALQFWLWLTKALVLSAHHNANQFVDLILNLFEDMELGESAAQGFFLILNETDDILSRAQHANIRLLYRQRFFVEHIQRLSKSFHQTKPELKKNYLIAVSYLFNFLPRQVFISELPPLIPMLVLALMSDESKLQLSTMTTLKTVLDESPALLSQHVNLIVPRLLKLSRIETSMKVRIASLECLEFLTELPSSTLLPYRREVIRFLGPVLDDKKRLVRKQAVKARSEWFLLGAPIN